MNVIQNLSPKSAFLAWMYSFFTLYTHCKHTRWAVAAAVTEEIFVVEWPTMCERRKKISSHSPLNITARTINICFRIAWWDMRVMIASLYFLWASPVAPSVSLLPPKFNMDVIFCHLESVASERHSTDWSRFEAQTSGGSCVKNCS